MRLLPLLIMALVASSCATYDDKAKVGAHRARTIFDAFDKGITPCPDPEICGALGEFISQGEQRGWFRGKNEPQPLAF